MPFLNSPDQSTSDSPNTVCPTQAFSVAQGQREQLQGHKAKVVWFTGLSGAGKSTIANALEIKLHAANKRTYILDGDNLRRGLNNDLGFGPGSRSENIRRIGEVAHLMMDAGIIVLVTAISPFRQDRELARKRIGAEHFFEIFINTPLAVCEDRDTKGLYKKSRSGELKNMTGIDSPYEAPENPALVIDSSCTDLSASSELIFNLLCPHL